MQRSIAKLSRECQEIEHSVKYNGTNSDHDHLFNICHGFSDRIEYLSVGDHRVLVAHRLLEYW